MRVRQGGLVFAVAGPTVHPTRLIEPVRPCLRWIRNRDASWIAPSPAPLVGFAAVKKGRSVLKCEAAEGAGYFNVSDYFEANVKTVSHTPAYGHVVYLQLLDDQGSLLPIYVGSFESAALIQEINKSHPVRPSTHDLMKNSLEVLGHKVSMVRINDLVSNTYYARVHFKYSLGDDFFEVDVDARPSDAINLAVRFKAPIYVSKKVAECMCVPNTQVRTRVNSEVVQSCREEVLHHHDPTVMMKLQLQVAVADERYSEAAKLRDDIDNMLATDRALRLVVALESALLGNRLEEATFLRDELRKLRTQKQVNGGNKGVK